MKTALSNRNQSWSRFKVLGHEVALQFFERLSTSDANCTTFFWLGNKKIDLHDRNMNAKVARLIPFGYATPSVKPEHWEPFVRMAQTLGLL